MISFGYILSQPQQSNELYQSSLWVPLLSLVVLLVEFSCCNPHPCSSRHLTVCYGTLLVTLSPFSKHWHPSVHSFTLPSNISLFSSHCNPSIHCFTPCLHFHTSVHSVFLINTLWSFCSPSYSSHYVILVFTISPMCWLCHKCVMLSLCIHSLGPSFTTPQLQWISWLAAILCTQHSTVHLYTVHCRVQTGPDFVCPAPWWHSNNASIGLAT